MKFLSHSKFSLIFLQFHINIFIYSDPPSVLHLMNLQRHLLIFGPIKVVFDIKKKFCLLSLFLSPFWGNMPWVHFGEALPATLLILSCYKNWFINKPMTQWNCSQGEKCLFEEMEQRDGEKWHPDDSVWNLDQKLYIMGDNNFVLPFFFFCSKINLHFIFCHLTPFTSSIQKQFILFWTCIETRV